MKIFRTLLTDYRSRSHNPLKRSLAVESLEGRTLLATVTIDPGAYVGTYDPAGQGTVTGPMDLELNPGTHNLIITNPTAILTFDVDAGGQVTSNHPDSAEGIGSTLQFKNTTVTFDPAAYIGRYQPLLGSPGIVTGLHTEVLVPGIDGYRMRLVNPAPTAVLSFDVDASGQVTSNNPDSAQGVGDTLLFENTTVTFDPGGFVGDYQPLLGFPLIVSGEHNQVLVPGIAGYRMRLMNPAPTAVLSFDVDASGQVTSNDPDSTQGAGDTLQFKNAAVGIDPGTFADSYNLLQIAQFSGPACVTLVPGVDGYQVRVQTETFPFDVDASGQPNPSSVTVSVGGQDHTFSLGTCIDSVEIDIKPGEFPNNVNLGSEGVIPVAILTNSVADGDSVDFDAADVDQSSLTLAGAAARVKGKSGNIGSFEDVDGDGDLDLVVQFATSDLNLGNGDSELVLEGATLDGTPIQGSDTINVVPAALHVRNVPVQPGPQVDLTEAILEPIVKAAVSHWSATGFDTTDLDSVDFHVSDLPGSLLGLAYSNSIVMDRDAAGHGWSIASEGDGVALGRVDLLSAVAHELGHLLGLTHSDDNDVMRATLHPALGGIPDSIFADAIFADKSPDRSRQSGAIPLYQENHEDDKSTPPSRISATLRDEPVAPPRLQEAWISLAGIGQTSESLNEAIEQIARARNGLSDISENPLDRSSISGIAS